MRSRSKIEATLDRIFADHETSTYVGNVREELAITDDVSLVLAVCGMVPPGRERTELGGQRDPDPSRRPHRRRLETRPLPEHARSIPWPTRPRRSVDARAQPAPLGRPKGWKGERCRS